MPQKDGTILVIGGVNVDISGTSFTPIVSGDSNPGYVTVTMGGVGRNIAENLCRLGASVKMITALGEDANAQQMRANCRQVGIDLSHSLTVAGGRTSTYLCLNDSDGEIAVAVSDMSIYDELTPEFLQTKLDVINEAALVILDGNLSKEAIDFLAENCTAPMAADPVSSKKAEKMKDAQGRFVFMKPNRMEASLLTGLNVTADMTDLVQAASAFFMKGMRYVIVSLGRHGVYYNDGDKTGILPNMTDHVVNTTGCGDAFMAAAALGFVQGKSLYEMARMGLAASAVCSRSNSAVNPEISYSEIMKVLEEE
ncbi:MAG: carbohydrate kinase family protein [Clostridia bacterium]|nr:carbohydrate kinase family protein [Clostridia bacterium]